MLIYQSDKAGFLADAFKGNMGDLILAVFQARTHRAVAPAELQSWEASLTAMAKVLNDEVIPADCGVAIGYGIPQTSKRIDFLLSGQDAQDGEHLLIVELKQWQYAQKTGMDGIVVTRFGHGEARVSHPSYQAWSYASLLQNFNETVYTGDIDLHPCAYLHNHGPHGDILDACYSHYLHLAPVFLKGDAEIAKLRDFIKKHVRFGDRNRLLYRIDSGRIRPSKGLVESLQGMLAGKKEFVLVDDQKVIYETAFAAAVEALDGRKRVVIVEGGPGTGKSVVAVNLLVATTSKRLVSKYVTKNAAPRAVFQSVLSGTHRKTDISNLFSGSGSFIDSEPDTFDALIVDEAHRLNEKSGLYQNQGANQIKELIRAAKCTIFFIDEDQRVTFNDIGQKSEIVRFAREAGAEVTELALTSQFRCSGSDGYLAWLDNTLAIRETANETLGCRDFDFRVFDSPETLRREIVGLNESSNKARMVAGYCWDWASKKGGRVADVVIPEHRFGMQWNLTKDGSLWIVARESVGEIGCIHTCQGLELDYVGVIVGPDLVVRGGEVLTRAEMRSRHDQSIKGYKKMLAEDPDAARHKADRIIKNTYRTLMTRGMKGCYVYFTDEETARYFRGRLECRPTDERFDGGRLPGNATLKRTRSESDQ